MPAPAAICRAPAPLGAPVRTAAQAAQAFFPRAACRGCIRTASTGHAALGPHLSHPRRPARAISAMVGPLAIGDWESIDEATRESLTEDAIVWAAQNGLLVGLGGDAPDAATIHAPLSLLPTPIPRRLYEQGLVIAQALNEMIDRVAGNGEYLEETLATASQFDDFTKRLLEVFRATKAEQAAQEITLGLHRSDYMLDAPSDRLLQVELNTIASSFGCLSTQVSKMHRYTLERAGITSGAEDLPDNGAMAGLAAGLVGAAKAYGVEGAVIMMVVQPGEKNAYDQRWLDAEVWKQAKIRTVRKSLREIEEECVLSEDGRLLLAPGGAEVAVAYMRAGYTPDDYPSEVEWAGRTKMERGRAVKCPSITYHLAGSKKVQQDLARPGVLEKFIPDPVSAAKVRESFAGLWSLDGEGAGDVIAMALEDPDAFVLKPQREGGGNNLYGEELVERLQQREGLGAFILMQRIRPPPQSGLLVRRGEVTAAETLSELGIYQVYLKKGGDVLINEPVGHLLRTKTSSSNEGGVAAGFAVLDSPYLCD